MNRATAKHLKFFLCCGATALGISTVLSGATVAAAEPVTCAGRTATIVGTNGADDLVGTQGDDVIQALRGFDTIVGRGGRDLICGARGADEIAGGTSADRIFAGPGGYVGDDEGSGTWFGNKVDGGPGNDYLSGGPDHDIDWPEFGSTPDTVSFVDAAGPITVRPDGTVTGPGIGTDSLAPDFELIVGTPYADRMSTVGARSDLAGLGGGDRLHVGANLVDITLEGGAGDDRLDGQAAKKWMILDGGAGKDLLLGSPGADQLDPGTGVDVVRAFGGNDEVLSRGVSTDLTSDASVDAGSGDDLIAVGDRSGGTTVAAGPGRDTLLTGWSEGTAVLDAPDGTVRVGDIVSRFRGVESYRFASSQDGTGGVRFIGTAAPEFVRLTFQPFFGAADIRLAGGADVLRMTGSFTTSTHADGGAGDDILMGSWADDDLFGGAGDDTVDGARGIDDCDAEHVTNCES